VPYKGEAVPLNKPLEFSCFNVMENKGSTSRQQRLSSTSRQQRLSSTSRQQRLSGTITASHRISETRSPAESEANSPYENHGTSCPLAFLILDLVTFFCGDIYLACTNIKRSKAVGT
jgi:hypothetical protein